jgi:hypothetical protein
MLLILLVSEIHGRMTRGGHGLPKVLPGSTMPHPSTPCGRVTPETACVRLLTLWTPYAYAELFRLIVGLPTCVRVIRASIGATAFHLLLYQSDGVIQGVAHLVDFQVLQVFFKVFVDRNFDHVWIDEHGVNTGKDNNGDEEHADEEQA